MVNNFAVVKLRAQSRKFILVRIKPRRGIEYSLALDSGNVHQMTFPYLTLCGIAVNGVDLTKVDGTPGNATEYSFNNETGLLKVYLTSNIVNYQTTDSAIMASYYLHYTNDLGKYYYSDPDDDTSDEVFYEPRISNDPSFSVSQDNIIDGILSIGNLTLSLNNQDNDFNQYITDYDSFSRCEFKSWHCLDELGNIKRLFFGSVIDLSLDSGEVSFSVDNLFGLFENTYISNETLIRSTYDNPNFTVSDDNRTKYILKLYGKISKSSQSKDLDLSQGAYVPVGFLESNIVYRFDQIHRAVNVDYNTTISKTNNRIWACCIDSVASSTHQETIAGKTAASFGSVATTRITVADASKYFPGDHVVTDIAGTPHCNAVMAIDLNDNWVFLSDSNFLNAQTITRPSISVVQWVVGGTADQGRIQLRYIEDYTIDVIDGVRCIVLNDNFEDNYSAFGFDQVNGIFPDAVIEFRAWNHDDINHAVVLQEVIESLGLTVNQDSFDDAALEDLKTNFTLPFWGSSDMPSVRDIIQSLISSTFGYITINNDFEIEYQLFSRPFPTESVTETEIIKGTISQKIDYKDVYTNIQLSNDHDLSVYNDPRSTSRYNISEKVEYYYDKGRFYHGINKSKSLKHIIEDIYNTGIGNKISFVLGNRRLTLSVDTKGYNFESIVGDDYTIESSKVVGSDGMKDIKLLSIDKAPTRTRISGIDLLGLDE